jgi:hypothetical protein
MEISISTPWPWLALFALGALHGINPGMGWLFAVALGLQEERRSAVWRAIVCLAAGHALAIAAAAAVAIAVGIALPAEQLKWLVASALIALGLIQLVRHGHPRYGGMSVGPREVTIWSFLMASAHGAGLMALPFVIGAGRQGAVAHAGHGVATHVVPPTDAPLLAGFASEHVAAALGTVVHTVGYLLVTALVAVIVYEKVGLGMLRRAWLNVRVLWAAALIVTGVLTPLV